VQFSVSVVGCPGRSEKAEIRKFETRKSRRVSNFDFRVSVTTCNGQLLLPRVPKCTISPSCTTYSFPSRRKRARDAGFGKAPRHIRSSYFVTSARMNPPLDVEWISPRLPSPSMPARIVHARHSSRPR